MASFVGSLLKQDATQWIWRVPIKVSVPHWFAQSMFLFLMCQKTHFKGQLETTRYEEMAQVVLVAWKKWTKKFAFYIKCPCEFSCSYYNIRFTIAPTPSCFPFPWPIPKKNFTIIPALSCFPSPWPIPRKDHNIPQPLVISG
jgi:hypothetical protein